MNSTLKPFQKHANYEGIIPEGTYGAGPVLIWDKGSFKAIDNELPTTGLAKGNLKFDLHGRILKGAFALVKLHGPGRERNWLLIKKHRARQPHFSVGDSCWRWPEHQEKITTQVVTTR